MKPTKHDQTEFATQNPQCRCAEDDNCGCTFPENIAAMCYNEGNTCTHENFKIKTHERFIQKDTVCYCTPKDCDCKIDYQETDY